MNQRESSGLPLRAMVMVLLFLGVVFLLVAFQSMGSDDQADSSESTAITTITAMPTSTSTSEAPAKPEVRVYNVSEVAGAAENTANRLRDQQWDAKAENLTPATAAASRKRRDSGSSRSTWESIIARRFWGTSRSRTFIQPRAFRSSHEGSSWAASVHDPSFS